jgi:autotransporter-associated beta strand protein
MILLPIHKATRPGSRVNFPSLPGKCAMRRRGLVLLSGLSLLLALPARALETVMQDDFALASGVPVDPAKWTVRTPGVFKVNSGSSWSFFQGILGANAAAAYAEVKGFSGKDVVVEFDLNRFTQNSDFFDLVLRQNAGGNTRVRFAANTANNKITVAIMQPGSATTSTALGTTSFILGQYDWASFRVRINDSRVQVFAKESWNPEYTLLGEYVPDGTNFINAGAGTVRIAMPQSSATNIVNLDGFKIRQADSGKKVFADFHGYRYTREHDGQLGNWKQALQSPQTPNHIANYNADLMDANGGHELASPGNPPIGMQSYNDPDYAEYHVLTAKMAGIDGFLHEYGCSAGLTDADVQLLQATAQTYGMEIGINWLDGFYYSFIESNAEYRAWCTTNSKNPALNATKLEYIPQVFQNLINWVYDKPNAATLGGKPLMPIFHGSPLTATEFATLKTKTYNYGGQTGVTVPFLMPRWAPMGLANESDPNVQKFWSDPWGWETQADGSYGWKPATERLITSAIYKAQGDERDAKEYARAHVAGMLKATNDRVNMAGVMPGFDNKFNAAWGQYAVELLDRKNGLTYTEVWDQYLRDRDVIDAVLVATWSDHTEGTGIEPMGDYGDRELRATAKYSAQFKGLADQSATLNFTLPKELFELRKLAKFLESAGYPSSALSADRALLDSAAYDIAAGAYANAATKLSTARTNLDTRRTNGIRETIHTLNFFTGSGVNVANSSDQYINIPDATADLVRSKNFDGVITFEYLDNSTFAANKTLYLLSYPAPASTGKPGENRSIQMQMRHGNGDGQWKTARVALNKKNLRLDHHVTSGALPIDLYFSSLGGASNGGTIRNVTVSLTTYELDSSHATVSLANGQWSEPGTWTNGVPQEGGAAGIKHTVTFQAGDSWIGGAGEGLLIGYDSWGTNWGLGGSGSGILNVTGGDLTTGALGLGAGLNEGNQTGTLNISGGTVTANGLMRVGWSTTPGSSVNVSGGVLNLTGVSSPFVVGHGATAAMNITGGTVNLNRSLTFNNSSTLTISGTGVLNINTGGALTVSPSIQSGGTLRFNGGAGNTANNLSVFDGTVDVNGQSLPTGTWANWLPRADGNRLLNSSTSPATIANGNTLWLWNTPSMNTSIETVGNLTIHAWVTGASGHAGGITKTGNGTLTLTNPGNDYTGHTVVNAGTLRFNHPTLANASDVRITSGAFLNLNFSGTDTVRSLYINGSKQAGGTWGAVGSGAQHQSPLITGTGFLQVANGAQFSDWATESGITGAQPGGDFDYDGITNLLEYALGLNPTAPSASPGTFDGSTISFNKGSAAVANDDLTYAIQTSPTLAAGSWTTVTPTVNSPSLISYTLPTGLTKIFARLLVSKIK